MKAKKNNPYFIWFALFLYTIMMSLVCVGSSPILDYMDPDSQNFWLIGRCLADGQVAYRDIFDHKGPYVYLIEYLAALLLGGSEMGLFLLEVCCSFINVIIVFKISMFFLKDKVKAFLSTIAFLGISFNFFYLCDR